jgi:hypothetical protein
MTYANTEVPLLVEAAPIFSSTLSGRPKPPGRLSIQIQLVVSGAGIFIQIF